MAPRFKCHCGYDCLAWPCATTLWFASTPVEILRVLAGWRWTSMRLLLRDGINVYMWGEKTPDVTFFDVMPYCGRKVLAKRMMVYSGEKNFTGSWCWEERLFVLPPHDLLGVRVNASMRYAFGYILQLRNRSLHCDDEYNLLSSVGSWSEPESMSNFVIYSNRCCETPARPWQGESERQKKWEDRSERTKNEQTKNGSTKVL